MKSTAVSNQNQKGKKAAEDLESLYETDETAWLEKMSRFITKGQYERLDYKNLSEFLSDMAKRDKREVRSRLRVLLAHLLKWDFQPRKRSGSWSSTIRTQRADLIDLLSSKTLKNHAQKILNETYETAVKNAIDETGLPEEKFPAECPYTLDEILTTD